MTFDEFYKVISKELAEDMHHKGTILLHEDSDFKPLYESAKPIVNYNLEGCHIDMCDINIEPNTFESVTDEYSLKFVVTSKTPNNHDIALKVAREFADFINLTRHYITICDRYVIALYDADVPVYDAWTESYSFYVEFRIEYCDGRKAS